MKKIHFLGIGGSGASGAAAIAQAQGFEVSGCDLEPDNEFTLHIGCVKFKGHSPEHLSGHYGSESSNKVDLLIVTPAIFSLDANNPELLAAKKLNIPVLTWQEFMGEYLHKDKFLIAVCGTHGKSTVTAISVKLLGDANLDPTVELGAIVPSWGKNFRVGKSKFFITEADEYNDNFQFYKPDITIITNIEMDHPEYFKDIEDVKKSFRNFLAQTKKIIIANLEDPNVADIIKDVMKDSPVTVIDYSKHILNLNLKVPGDFNKLNASAVFQLGLSLSLDPQTISQSLSSYAGLGRRFEFIVEFRGAQIYSDFGHHPTEIRKTMEAAREKFKEKRIVLLYEPHMFTRTKALFDDFVKVFQDLPIDQTFIIDIYPSREKDIGLTSSKELVDAIGKATVSYLGPKDEVEGFLKVAIRGGDVVFFMGAGDVDKIGRRVIED